MQPASAEGSNSDTGRALRRYGPIAAIAVVALVVIGVVIAGGGDDASAPVNSDVTTEPDATDDAPDDPATTDGGDPSFGVERAFRQGREVYRLLGKKGLDKKESPAVGKAIIKSDVGYHIRKGGHSIESYDWEQFLNFADEHLKK